MLEPEKKVPCIRYFSHFCSISHFWQGIIYTYIRHTYILIYKACLYLSRAKHRERLVPKQEFIRTLEVLGYNPSNLPPAKQHLLKALQPLKTGPPARTNYSDT